MIDIKEASEGDLVVWLGSPKRGAYGNRTTKAKIIGFKLDRIHIEIQTPSGTIRKYVTPKSLDWVEDGDVVPHNTQGTQPYEE